MSTEKKTNQFVIVRFPGVPLLVIAIGADIVEKNGFYWMPVALFALLIYTLMFRSVIDVLRNDLVFLMGYILIPFLGLLSSSILAALGLPLAKAQFPLSVATLIGIFFYFFVLFFHNRNKLVRLGWTVN